MPPDQSSAQAVVTVRIGPWRAEAEIPEIEAWELLKRTGEARSRTFGGGPYRTTNPKGPDATTRTPENKEKTPANGVKQRSRAPAMRAIAAELLLDGEFHPRRELVDRFREAGISNPNNLDNALEHRRGLHLLDRGRLQALGARPLDDRRDCRERRHDLRREVAEGRQRRGRRPAARRQRQREWSRTEPGMSGLTASWVLGHSESKGVLRMVLYVLAHNADDAGEGGMRLGVIARQAALEDRDQAEQAVQLLAKAGHIELVDRGRPRARPLHAGLSRQRPRMAGGPHHEPGGPGGG